jgi:excisionase family DNA binding protein
MSDTLQLLTPADVARMLGIPERTLGQWRYVGRGPSYRVVGRHVRYHPDDIVAWLARQKRGGPDAPAA